MPLERYYHPFASFCQKVLVALHDCDIAFAPRVVDLSQAGDRDMLAALSPMGRFPVLRDGERVIPESSIIIEHLAETRVEARRLVPRDWAVACAVRLWDRLLDAEAELPMQKIVLDHLRPEALRDATGVAEARATLRRFYGVLETRLGLSGEWIAGDFSMADCGAAPALYYAHWVEPFGADLPNCLAHLRRLAARPSFVRVLAAARDMNGLFPVPMPPPVL
jgi:glutathione S-transferase